MELRKAVLVRIDAGVIARVHVCVVVSEEEACGVGLIDIVVEVTSAGYRHRVPVQAMYISTSISEGATKIQVYRYNRW